MTNLGLAGNVAVITGSSKGWGAACATALAQEGVHIVVNGTLQQDIDNVVQHIRSQGGSAVGIAESVTTIAGAQRIINRALEAFGRLDILVNNAGKMNSSTILGMSEAAWDEVLAVQLKGVFNCSKLAALQMVKQGNGGRIINMAGGAGVRGMHANANHAASKGAVLAATFSWALELEPYGVTVNAVRAGVRTKTSTVVTDKVKHQLKALGRPVPSDRELGFFEPEEAAPLVVWLASRDAQDVTGQFIGIDGPKLVLWSLAQPGRTVYVHPCWTADLMSRYFKPLVVEAGQKSLGVLEVIPSLGHLTPDIQRTVEGSRKGKA